MVQTKQRRHVLAPDGVAHLTRESDGPHHVSVCGKYLRGEVVHYPNFDPLRVCRDCLARVETAWLVEREPAKEPAAVRQGRGSRGRALKIVPERGN